MHITVPGHRVMHLDKKLMVVGTSKIIRDVVESCTASPLTRDAMRQSAGSNSVSIHGPSGQKESNDFARAH
jgi:hypothetical protein